MTIGAVLEHTGLPYFGLNRQYVTALEAAGAFAIVLELVPAWLSAEVTAALDIPTIGIGAGPSCSGQVQVLADLLGLDPAGAPRHAKRYVEIGALMREALGRYAAEVARGDFPAPEHYTAGERPPGFVGPSAATPTAAEER